MTIAREEFDALVARVGVIEHQLGLTAPEPAPTPERPVTYTVAAGETLSGIALRYGLTVDQLVTWNGISDPNRISVGQVLRLTAPETAEPAPTPEPTPPASDLPGAVVLDARFRSTALRSYVNLQTRGHNGAPDHYTGPNLRLVEDPMYGTVGRFQVARRDVPNFGGGERCEVRLDSAANVREGDERWYRFSFMLDPEYASTDSDWFIITQWHAGDDVGGSPPLALQIQPDHTLVLANNRDWKHNREVADIQPGRWYEVTLHVGFSVDKGWAEMWLDGQQVLARHARPTLATRKGGYMKLGIYRDTDSETSVLSHTGILVVAPISTQ